MRRGTFTFFIIPGVAWVNLFIPPETHPPTRDFRKLLWRALQSRLCSVWSWQGKCVFNSTCVASATPTSLGEAIVVDALALINVSAFSAALPKRQTFPHTDTKFYILHTFERSLGWQTWKDITIERVVHWEKFS